MSDRNVSGMPSEGRPTALQRFCRLPRRQSFDLPQNNVSSYLRARQPAPVVQDPTARYNEFFPPQQLQSSPVYGCHTHGICPAELNRTPSMVADMNQTPSTFDRDIRDQDLADPFGVYEDMSQARAYKDLWGESMRSPQNESPLPRPPKRFRHKTTEEILEQCIQLAKYQSARRQILTDVATLSSPSDFHQPLGPGASTPEGSPARAPLQPDIEGISPIRGNESACPPCEE